MLFFHIKSALRSLKSNWRFALINIAGFAFSLSVCLAIFLFIRKENSYDKYHKNADTIIKLYDANSLSSSIDYRVQNELLANFPEIKNVCQVQCAIFTMDIHVDGETQIIDNLMSVDNNYFQMFDADFIQGEKHHAFVDINSVVLSEKAATALFGTTDVLGKEISLLNIFDLIVSGVIKDQPDNTSMPANIYVNTENKNFKFTTVCENSNDPSSFRYPCRIFIQTHEGVDQNELLSKINNNISCLQPYTEKIGFISLKEIYLNDHTLEANNLKGNPMLLKIFTITGFLILILAVINYVNLMIAQQLKQFKKIGIKKTIGASRSHIILSYLSESILVTFTSFIIAWGIIICLIPFFSTIFNTTLDIKLLLSFPSFILLTVFILIIGSLSGLFPAIIISRNSDKKAIQTHFTSSRKNVFFRYLLSTFQFAISIILTTCLIVIFKQIVFVKNTNPGFNEEQIICINNLNERETKGNRIDIFVNEIKKSPYVKNVSLTHGGPGNINQYLGTNIKGSNKNLSAPSILVDTNFIETFGIEIIQGRNIQHGDYGKVCMVNERFYSHFEFNNLENKRFENNTGYDIIAVVKDFHYSSMHEKIEPTCIIFDDFSNYNTINIKLESLQTKAGIDFIKTVWETNFPELSFEYEFYDKWFDTLYQKEERFSKAIGLFAILAIIISCIGVLGLSIFNSEQRIKEIGIRKTNGASNWNIIILLNRSLVRLIIIAFVISAPIAWLLMNKWLQIFAYRTPLSWWIFILAGFLSLVIAVFTISWQSLKTCRRNPIKSLRYE